MIHKRFAVNILTTFDSHFSLVWEAITNPDWIKHWYKPKNFKLIDLHYNASTGERWWFILQREDGHKFRSTGIFYFLKPYQKIIMSHSWQDCSQIIIEKGAAEDSTHDVSPLLYSHNETRIVVSLDRLKDKTRMQFFQTSFSSYMEKDVHYNVWIDCLSNLDDLLVNRCHYHNLHQSAHNPSIAL